MAAAAMMARPSHAADATVAGSFATGTPADSGGKDRGDWTGGSTGTEEAGAAAGTAAVPAVLMRVLVIAVISPAEPSVGQSRSSTGNRSVALNRTSGRPRR